MNIEIYADELLATKNSEIFTNLKKDASAADNIIKIISDFQTVSQGRLTGSMWENSFAKLNEFQAALVKRMETAIAMSDAINEAIQLLTDYLGEYPSLDLSQLDEIMATKRQCENQMAFIKKVMYSTKEEKYIDDFGEEQIRRINVYTSSEIEAFEGNVFKLEENIAEIQKLIDKLSGLEDVYNKAQQILEEAFSSVDSFGTSVSNIIPNNKVEYVR